MLFSTKVIISSSFPTSPSVNNKTTLSESSSYSANFIGSNISVPPPASIDLTYEIAFFKFSALYSRELTAIALKLLSNGIMLNLSPLSSCFKHSITACFVSSIFSPHIEPEISTKNRYSFSLSS